MPGSAISNNGFVFWRSARFFFAAVGFTACVAMGTILSGKT